MTSALPGEGVVAYQRRGAPDDIDAIDDYSTRLVDALLALGVQARYEPGGLAPVVAAVKMPSWVLLQYNPFRYGRWGFAPALLRDAWRLRCRRVPLAIMIHEAWVPMTGWRSTLMGLWQRAQLHALLRISDGVMASTEALTRAIGRGAVHMPIATNISPTPISREAARDRLGLNGALTIALFGRAHESRAFDHAEAAIAALAEAYGASRLAILNLGADAPIPHVGAGIEVRSPGRQTAEDLSIELRACDVVMLPLTDGLSTRRTTLMAALSHGRPVIGLAGCNTDSILADARDALVLTPAGDPATFAREAVALTRDQEHLRAIGDAGLRLYDSRFDWPVLARNVAGALRSVAAQDATRSRAAATGGEVVFVAHDVGGLGGMERQSEQLINRLLDAGRPVTVIARTCALRERPNLRFVRVPTPRRPFSLAYPAFFAVATLIAARHRTGLLHSTGAIVANRVDVSTVHYCHRAAATHMDGSRASRPGMLYRLNASVSPILSRVAEVWCYRRTRARVLCAVSEGVAAELRTGFPAMAQAVRTVSNGVDCTAFSPDPALRREARAELGIDDAASVAMFVGGDWGRKGLAYAVDAIALAPGWHLVVAGAGDPSPHAARARRAGSESRLHFLGTVHDMRRLYAAADAFVLPTAYETFSLVTFEAAASGLPLLVTRVHGVEDLLRDGSNGWFITRDDRDIARRLSELRSDAGLARRMAASARAAATAYSWGAMADGYLSVYAEIEDGAHRDFSPVPRIPR